MERPTFTFPKTVPNALMAAPGNVKVGLHKIGDTPHYCRMALHHYTFYLFTLYPFTFHPKDGSHTQSEQSHPSVGRPYSLYV